MTAEISTELEEVEEEEQEVEKNPVALADFVCATCGRRGGYRKNPTDKNCARCENKIKAKKLLAKQNNT